MEIRATHWMAALVFSVAIHTLIVQVLYSPGGPGATGSRGVSVQLGTFGAATEAVAAAAEALATEAATRMIPAGNPVPNTTLPLSPRIPRSVDVAPDLPDARHEDIEFATEPVMAAANAKSIEVDVATTAQAPDETARPRQEILEPVTASPVRALDTRDVATAEEAVATTLAATVAPGSSVSPEPSAAGQPDSAGSGRSGLAQDYYTGLAMWIGRHKKYPGRARRGGQEGTVEVEFVIDKDGRLLEHRIVSSSGFKLLDEAAYALIERAAPMPSIPANMGSEVLTITAPISFSLR